MPSSPHPLDALVGPIRYASARGFANLANVKDLRPHLAAAIDRARGKLDPSRLSTLEQQLGAIDSDQLAPRRAAVSAVVAVLAAEGFALEAGAAPPPAPPPPRAPVSSQTGGIDSSDPLHKALLANSKLPPPARPEQTSLVDQMARTVGASPFAPKKPVEAPKAAKPAKEPKAPKKKKGSLTPTPLPEGEGKDTAKILSIAPKSGSLATLLKNVGWRINPRLVGALNKKGLLKTGDILFLLPRVYEDRRELRKIAQLVSGERGTVIAEVTKADEVYGRGRRQFRAVLADSSGSISAVYFQSGPWLKAKFPVGKKLVISGEARQSSYGWEMPHPETEPADDVESSPVHFNRIVPVYSGFERHEQRSLRELAFRIADKYAVDIDEPLPDELRTRLKLPGLGEALKYIHFPPGDAKLPELDAHASRAHKRLAFDELFFLQLGMALRRRGVKVQPGIAFEVTEKISADARALLPFKLTGAQERVVKQLEGDMARAEPMNRLVQGDVGSGKTAVALIAAAIAVKNGYQVAVMAPTEILAEQHFRTFSKWFAGSGVEVGLVTGSGSAKEKTSARERVASGQVKVAVGTHALIEGSVGFDKLGLVVIDEQHRFGVMQRHTLTSKGVRPDVMVMTATPIPRTLAMTMYGDLDVSVIDELPPGRTPIETKVYSDRARPKAWELVKSELAKGHQAYVIYPLVEESEKIDLADATQGAEQLKTVFPEARVGLLHGRMKQAEKDAVMNAFRAHEIDVLVSTTVVEVGVDVPNASVMVMEHAERFGLSQLHQLRGRVGRGAAKSYCVLLASYAQSEVAGERLAVMEQSSDGFVIAERDLEIRGPGEFLGTRQSGMPELAVANLVRDQPILSVAREEARAIIDRDPELAAPEHQRLVRALEERWEGRLKLASVG
ncbi:MAG: ATP-dependent DNA helicase RecG [Archangium sp.]|nr:ATP-dependent DNA helicase RecG [Archangium sp.]